MGMSSDHACRGDGNVNPMNASDLHDRALTDDQTLQEGMEALLAPVVRRQLWMLFLDERDVLINPLMPTDDFPRSPHDRSGGDASDDRSAAQAIADCFAEVMGEFGIPQLLIVWERPGRAPLDAETREWARELGARLRAAGVRVRAQCLLSGRGVRILRPDDLI